MMFYMAPRRRNVILIRPVAVATSAAATANADYCYAAVHATSSMSVKTNGPSYDSVAACQWRQRLGNFGGMD